MFCRKKQWKTDTSYWNFLIIKMILDVSETGYILFRSNIHQLCMTGILHGIFIHLSIDGFSLIMRRFFGKIFTTIFLLSILSLQTYGYYFIDPLVCGINLIFYSVFIYFIHIRHYKNRNALLRSGIIKFMIGWVMMEIIGHWYLETSHSDLSKVINSVYWTQLYGFQSILGRINCIQ